MMNTTSGAVSRSAMADNRSQITDSDAATAAQTLAETG
jgi:hypothetical protein